MISNYSFRFIFWKFRSFYKTLLCIADTMHGAADTMHGAANMMCVAANTMRGVADVMHVRWENGLFQTHPPTKSGKFQIFF